MISTAVRKSSGRSAGGRRGAPLAAICLALWLAVGAAGAELPEPRNAAPARVDEGQVIESFQQRSDERRRGRIAVAGAALRGPGPNPVLVLDSDPLRPSGALEVPLVSFGPMTPVEPESLGRSAGRTGGRWYPQCSASGDRAPAGAAGWVPPPQPTDAEVRQIQTATGRSATEARRAAPDG